MGCINSSQRTHSPRHRTHSSDSDQGSEAFGRRGSSSRMPTPPPPSRVQSSSPGWIASVSHIRRPSSLDYEINRLLSSAQSLQEQIAADLSTIGAAIQPLHENITFLVQRLQALQESRVSSLDFDQEEREMHQLRIDYNTIVALRAEDDSNGRHFHRSYSGTFPSSRR